MIKAALGVMIAVVLAGCSTTPSNKNNYQAYLETVKQVEINQAVAKEASVVAQRTDYNDMLKACTSDNCVASVASYKAIADTVASLAGQGSNNSNRIAAPQREVTFGDRAIQWAGLLVPGSTSWAGIVETNKTQRHLSDNTSAERISQNQMWSEIVGQSNQAWSTVASSPNIVVGGNYGNTTTTTNTAGNNLVSGDGNVIGNRNNNSGRQDSLGPIDNSGDCRTGDDVCNQEPTP